MAKLVCIAGMTKGDEYDLEEGETLMGRSESNDICVLDNMSSRVHCKIINNGGELSIVDMNSTNGFLVNETKVEGSRPLKTNDKICIGYTIYVVGNSDPSSTQTKLNTLLKNVKSNRVVPAMSQQKTRLKI